MRDRFTRQSRQGRGNIPKGIRREVFKRDSFTCQFCGHSFPATELTIDHLVPLAQGGLDEITNYVSCCRKCNQRKADLPLKEFAESISVEIDKLPIHGDPVIDNEDIPLKIRLLRKKIFDRYRKGKLKLSGKNAQKKLEKRYRRKFWETSEGKALEAMFPSLPGHTRVMIPEIKTIANNVREFLLLVELAKSANTRNLIGTVLNKDTPNIESRFRASIPKTRDPALRKRVEQALVRFEKSLAKHGISE